jgi:hypothetical protein
VMRLAVMGDELLNEFTCIADHGEQKNSWNQAGGRARWRKWCLRLWRDSASYGRACHSFSLFLQLPGNRLEDAKTDEQSRGKCQQNGPGV